MNILLKRFDGIFKGMITGFDRIVFKGAIVSLSFAEGAMHYLSRRGVLNKCFREWATENSCGLCEAVEKYSMEMTGRPIVPLPSWRERKEKLAHDRQAGLGIRSGLVGVWSCQEMGRTFKARFVPGTGRPVLVPRRVPLKHLYLYFDHVDYGFMSVRLQTWFPFHVQISLNGREWMRRSLEKRGIDFSMAGNKLVRCEDLEPAQAFLDAQLDARWVGVLDGLLKPAFPTMREALGDGFAYYWTLWQSEWATDFICDSPRDLEPVMDSLLRHAFMTGTGQRVLRYMGRPVTKSGYPGRNTNYEVSSRFSEYYEGVRSRHWAGSNSVKVYNEHNILRVETTINDPGAYRVWRRKQNDPEKAPKQLRPLRKGVADTPLRAKVCQEINDRFSAGLADMADDHPLRDLLLPLTFSLSRNGRRTRGLNPLGRDLELLKAIADPAFGVDGISNKALREKLSRIPWGAGRTGKQLSGKVSRHLRILRNHGLIRKMPGRRKYLLTGKGRETTTALLAMLSASTQKLMEIAA